MEIFYELIFSFSIHSLNQILALFTQLGKSLAHETERTLTLNRLKKDVVIQV